MICRCCKSIPYVGRALALVEGRLPDDDSRKVAGLLQSLSKHIKTVTNDIRWMEKRINLATVQLQYCDIVTKIETGIEYLSKITENTNRPTITTNYKERLKDLCSNERMTLAVKNLLKGLTGEGLLHINILKVMYSETRGHRRKVESMCVRFLQLFVGGLAVISTYETLVRGDEAALEMDQLFDGDADRLKTRFESVQQKCKSCFKNFMLEDLEEVIGSSRSNEEAVAYLKESFQEKYDWLETYCVACNESSNTDYGFIGDHVKILNCNGRFGVIFYREIREGPESRDRQILVNVRQILKEIEKDRRLSDAERINNALEDRLRSIGIGLWGCATVKTKLCIGRNTLDSFKTSVRIGETCRASVFDIGCRKHLCLVSPYEEYLPC